MRVRNEGKALFAHYEYDIWGNCTVYDSLGNVDTNFSSIGNINPFRWKGFYYDMETELYYANGSYYDPQTGKYLDASHIDSVFENAYSTRSLDRNGLMCNNVLALVGNLHTVETVAELSADLSYDRESELNWFAKIQVWVSKQLAVFFKAVDSLDVWLKFCVGLALVVVSVLLIIGASIPTGGLGGAGMLSSMEMMIAVNAATAAAMKTAIVELCIGIGFAVAGWLAEQANGEASSLDTALANATFFAGIFLFISAGINIIKYLCRSNAKDTIVFSNRETPYIGSKLDYAFGKATGNTHNITRSQGMLMELERIGIRDNTAGRVLLRNNLEKSYYTLNNVLVRDMAKGTVVKESFLCGPYGYLVVQSTWNKNKLITIMFKR